MRKHENNVVLVDMDGVMADFDSAALATVAKNLVVPRGHFYVTDDYPEHMQPRLEAIYNEPGFFETLEPMPNLFEGWQTLIDNGYHPQVASSPMRSNPTCTEDKIRWLDRVMVPQFGPQVVEEAIIDKNKWKYNGLVLVDDRPDVPRGPNGQQVATWEHVLFGWEHLSLSDVPMAAAALRLTSWGNIDQLLYNLHKIQNGQ